MCVSRGMMSKTTARGRHTRNKARGGDRSEKRERGGRGGRERAVGEPGARAAVDTVASIRLRRRRAHSCSRPGAETERPSDCEALSGKIFFCREIGRMKKKVQRGTHLRCCVTSPRRRSSLPSRAGLCRRARGGRRSLPPQRRPPPRRRAHSPRRRARSARNPNAALRRPLPSRAPSREVQNREYRQRC